MHKVYLLICACFICLFAKAQTPELVAEISPGHAEPSALTVWNNKLYFFANDARHGIQIWYYDGLNAPAMVPNASITINAIAGMAVYHGKLYFTGSTSTTGNELCSYDGINPPQIAADIVPGPLGAGPYQLTLFNDKLFFQAASPLNGRELFSFDGTQAKFYDVYPGPASSTPGNLIEYNGNLYFSPTLCQLTGLWLFDPLGDSVRALPNVGIESNGSPIVAGGKMFFSGNTTDSLLPSLFSYTGTGAAKQETSTKINNIMSVGYPPMAAMGNSLYFLGVVDPTHSSLFKRDLVTGSVKAVVPFFYDPRTALPGGELLALASLDSKLYFTGIIDTAVGFELYQYDGSKVSLVSDLWPGAASGSPVEFKAFNGKLYMCADNGTTGRELYRLTPALGVQSVAWRGTAVVYPNPATNTATLTISLPAPEALQVTLINAAGQELYKAGLQTLSSGKHDFPLPVKELAAGQYFYRISGGNGAVLASGAIIHQ